MKGNIKKIGPHRSAFGLLVGLLLTSSAMGQGQSPIDLRSSDAASPALQFNYGIAGVLTVVNTGSPDKEATVKANVPAGAGHRLHVGGVAYNLLHFHLHTPSEHRLLGKQFPMEMHLVHQASDGTLLEVAIFIDIGPANVGLSAIWGAGLPAPGATRMVQNFDLSRLLPMERNYFRYSGSLTTPPFTEGVEWIVMAKPITMTSQQIQQFRVLFPNGNSRELQPRS